jgi:hypothetical protein
VQLPFWGDVSLLLPMRKHGAFLLAVPMLPTEAPDAASRPGGRLAVAQNSDKAIGMSDVSM